LKIILGQATKSLISGIALTLVIIIMFSVGQFLLIGCASYFNSSETKLSNFYTAYNDHELRFGTNPIAISGMNAYKKLGMLEEYKVAMQKYVRSILYHDTAQTGFEQYVFTTYVEMLAGSFLGTDRCVSEFEEGTGVRDSTRIGNEYYTRLKTYCVSPGVFEKFQLSVAEGKNFADFNDFVYREGMTVPVVMGHEYRGYYRVGDLINGSDGFMIDMVLNYDQHGQITSSENVYSKLTFEVVGFLEPGAAILDPENAGTVDPISLDQHVLIPPIDYTELLFDESRAKRHEMYLINIGPRTVGVVVVQKGNENDVNAFYDSLGMDKLPHPIAVVNHPLMIVSGIFKLEAKNYFKTLLATAGLIVASATLCLSINMTNKLLSNFKTYAIHQISGGTLSGVKWIMVTEGIILMVISNLLAFGGAFLFGDKVFTYTKSQIFGISVAGVSPIAVLFALGVSRLILFFSMLVPFIKISRVEFDTLLRGRE